MTNPFTTQREHPIKVGEKWKQTTPVEGKKPLIRIIEIIAAPTLSSAVGYRIVRNDAHPHRKGKTASIRVADLRAKYEAVSA